MSLGSWVKSIKIIFAGLISADYITHFQSPRALLYSDEQQIQKMKRSLTALFETALPYLFLLLYILMFSLHYCWAIVIFDSLLPNLILQEKTQKWMIDEMLLLDTLTLVHQCAGRDQVIWFALPLPFQYVHWYGHSQRAALCESLVDNVHLPIALGMNLFVFFSTQACGLLFLFHTKDDVMFLCTCIHLL